MNINEIQVTNQKVNYSALADMVEFAVEKSFNKNGVYHKYLQDYAETLVLLAVMTNYRTNDEEKSISDQYDEVMEIANSSEWKNMIVPQFGDFYNLFTEYVDNEIENRMRPLAKMDEVLESTKRVLDLIYNVASQLDMDAIKNFDFDGLANALKDLESTNIEKKNNEEKIVPIGEGNK